jgi:hypothetical protein
MECLIFLLTFLAALGSGVMAGLFFAFSAFIMTAFSRLPWAGGIAAMQSINATILNPVFFVFRDARGLPVARHRRSGPMAGARLALPFGRQSLASHRQLCRDDRVQRAAQQSPCCRER